MKIFSDFHHSALADSLRMLFEERLKHEIYFPKGMDWYPDYWKIGDPYGEAGKFTAMQFLESSVPKDRTQVLHPYRGITLEEFKNMEFDILIASYNDHVPVYYDLIQKYQPKAKLIVQMGNEWPVHPLTKNLMSSTAPFPVDSSINSVFYHQEFDTTLFSPPIYYDNLHINSFVNALNINEIFKQDYRDFIEVRSAFPDYYVRSYGGGCIDGSVTYPQNMAKKMRETFLCLHFKSGGDGYGHVLYEAAACGVPIIFKGSQYEGKLAKEILSHGETAIDYEIVGSAEGLYHFVKSLDIEKMRENMYNRFQDKVDFSAESRQVEQFLERLQ